jgi:hypothetical protein
MCFGVAMADEDDDVGLTISGEGESVGISVSEHCGKQKVKVGGLTVETNDSASIIINGSNQTRTIKCEGDSVRVNGSNNDLRLRGECGKVNVIGFYNTMKIEAVAVISLLGSHNDVAWERGVGRNTPRISNLGSYNDIEQVE